MQPQPSSSRATAINQPCHTDGCSRAHHTRARIQALVKSGELRWIGKGENVATWVYGPDLEGRGVGAGAGKSHATGEWPVTLLDYKALLMCPRPPSTEILSRRLLLWTTAQIMRSWGLEEVEA